jgi:NAD(P)-dependent dehydrogenase (short-subunit alcohol dehydrogenase family)
MDDRPGRRAITAITSVDGFSSLRFHVAYGAAKAGIIPLVKMYSDDFGRYGIRVNCVVPGNVGGECGQAARAVSPGCGQLTGTAAGRWTSRMACCSCRSSCRPG